MLLFTFRISTLKFNIIASTKGIAITAYLKSLSPTYREMTSFDGENLSIDWGAGNKETITVESREIVDGMII